MFCREQIAQLRDYYPRIRQRDAELYVIGPGSAEQARKTATDFDVEYSVLADPKLEAFRAAGMRRDLLSNLNLRTIRHFGRTFRKGIRQAGIQGNPFQQGGALVIDQGGKLLFHFVGKAAGDHPALEDLVVALPGKNKTC